MNYLLMLTTLFVTSGLLHQCKSPGLAEIDYYQQSLEESLIPIRPGIPGESPFWNKYATRFINIPSFDFKPIEGAAHYRFTATSECDGMDYVFTAEQPWSLFLFSSLLSA